MLGYSPSWRYNRICNEKIRFKHDRHAFFRYHPCCISRDNDLTSAIRYHHPSRFFKRGMGNFKQYYLEPDQIKRFIEAHIMSHRIHEGEIIQYIIKRVLKTINIYSILYPVKIPESCIMIVMGMRPDHPINMTDLFSQKLPPKIGTGIYKESFAFGFHKNRKTKSSAFSTCQGIKACGAGTTYFRCSYRVACSK